MGLFRKLSKDEQKKSQRLFVPICLFGYHHKKTKLLLKNESKHVGG